MFSDVYVHYTQKRALYGFDPIRALHALRRQIPYLNSAEFLRELTLLINRLRDQHTQLYVDAADANLTPYVAALPFLVEVFGPHRTPTYVVTKVTDDVADADFDASASAHASPPGTVSPSPGPSTCTPRRSPADDPTPDAPAP